MSECTDTELAKLKYMYSRVKGHRVFIRGHPDWEPKVIMDQNCCLRRQLLGLKECLFILCHLLPFGVLLHELT